MKNLFPGYVRKSDDEINKLWSDAIICFDTNVLLSLYRYSDETKKALLDLMHDLGNQIRIPKHVIEEYHKNRFEVIVQQQDPYDELVRDLEKVYDRIRNQKSHPFFSEDVNNLAKQLTEKITVESQKAKATLEAQLKKDDLFEILCSLFENKIGLDLADQNIEKIGVERYKKKIPPGYKDSTKQSNIYGDLIIWLQILDFACNLKKPIILITSDQKEDWYWIIKGNRKLGPRPELVSEMKLKANQDFHIYDIVSFLEYGNKYFKKNEVSVKIINEIKESNLEQKASPTLEVDSLLNKIKELHNIARSRDLTQDENNVLIGLEILLKSNSPISRLDKNNQIRAWSDSLKNSYSAFDDDELPF